MTSEVHPTHQACLEAIDRIARTPDGATFYVFLQRRLMSISLAETDGALRLDQGERTFAAKLIAAMAKGIFESGGRTGSSDGTSSTGDGEQPIVLPGAKPVRSGRERNPGGRRSTEYTRVPGYDSDET
jgi:hypothetical protein